MATVQTAKWVPTGSWPGARLYVYTGPDLYFGCIQAGPKSSKSSKSKKSKSSLDSESISPIRKELLKWLVDFFILAQDGGKEKIEWIPQSSAADRPLLERDRTFFPCCRSLPGCIQIAPGTDVSIYMGFLAGEPPIFRLGLWIYKPASVPLGINFC